MTWLSDLLIVRELMEKNKMRNHFCFHILRFLLDINFGGDTIHPTPHLLSYLDILWTITIIIKGFSIEQHTLL